MYDVVCHVSTDQLTTENPTGHPHVLEIEVHEDGFLAKILVAPGSRVAPDEPIAVFCEERNDIPAFSDFSLAPGDLVSPGSFCWQAYVKEGQVQECGKGSSKPRESFDFWLGHRADD
eukprot:CAMPEP_0119302084 /NCGR_PEP_ID=MMETSP1333-20130426/3748_1 /TAXON_ID=418940 /ORGANISM="Scyphosphaera apsteinii, Strain RCC1455" /LENGTH=116 /DNA_ID=CAMNT_0007304335 /DNA_START=319 /DNA_END=669 /DNA_ORIENTATION=-